LTINPQPETLALLSDRREIACKSPDSRRGGFQRDRALVDGWSSFCAVHRFLQKVISRNQVFGGSDKVFTGSDETRALA
jgi:hypothetical protein